MAEQPGGVGCSGCLSCRGKRSFQAPGTILVLPASKKSHRHQLSPSTAAREPHTSPEKPGMQLQPYQLQQQSCSCPCSNTAQMFRRRQAKAPYLLVPTSQDKSWPRLPITSPSPRADSWLSHKDTQTHRGSQSPADTALSSGSSRSPSAQLGHPYLAENEPTDEEEENSRHDAG